MSSCWPGWVLSADGHQIPGWVTAPDVLRAIGRQLTTAQAQTQQAQVSADWDHADPGELPQHPPTPLPGYRLTEITITAGSLAAGRTLADVSWPPGSTPVTVLRGRQLRAPQPGLTLSPGDRVSLLTAAPDGPVERHPSSDRNGHPTDEDETTHHS